MEFIIQCPPSVALCQQGGQFIAHGKKLRVTHVFLLQIGGIDAWHSGASLFLIAQTGDQGRNVFGLPYCCARA